MADVIELLEHDHREVEQMFIDYEQATTPADKRAIVDKIIIELVRHSEAATRWSSTRSTSTRKPSDS